MPVAMVSRIVRASMGGQTQETALKAALDKVDQAPLQSAEVVASSRAHSKPGRGASQEEKMAAHKQDLAYIDVSSLMVDFGSRQKISKVLDARVKRKDELCKVLLCSNGSLHTFLEDVASEEKSKVRVSECLELVQAGGSCRVEDPGSKDDVDLSMTDDRWYTVCGRF